MNQAAQRGLTLIETSITLALAAVLATGGVSSFTELLERRQIEGVAAELASDLQFVRSEAVARNQGVRISFGSLPSGASCYVIHTGAASACSCAAAVPAQCVGTAQALKAVQGPARGDVLMQSNVASMLYDPVRGTTSPAASIAVAAPDRPGLLHVVNILGRVRTCSPAGGLPGYRAC